MPDTKKQYNFKVQSAGEIDIRRIAREAEATTNAILVDTGGYDIPVLSEWPPWKLRVSDRVQGVLLVRIAWLAHIAAENLSFALFGHSMNASWGLTLNSQWKFLPVYDLDSARREMRQIRKRLYAFCKPMPVRHRQEANSAKSKINVVVEKVA